MVGLTTESDLWWVQMPKGVPVATVAIGNAANAGLLAVRLLGASDPALLNKMLKYQVGHHTFVYLPRACTSHYGVLFSMLGREQRNWRS